MKKVYIGLDVHKAFVTIALAFAGTEEPKLYGKAPADLDSFLRVLRRILKKYELSKKDVALCYEAGPTGFVLARRLRQLHFDIDVIAPSKTPTRSGDRVKTDRRDARKLADLLRAGQLTAVHIPDATDEVIRDVCRARTDDPPQGPALAGTSEGFYRTTRLIKQAERRAHGSSELCLLVSLLSSRFIELFMIKSKDTHCPGTNLKASVLRHLKQAVRPGTVRFGSTTNTQMSNDPRLDYKCFAEPEPACSSDKYGTPKRKGEHE
jgi:hypothetical protein